MRRREFITTLGGATLTLPLAARAQRLVMPVIGFLNSGSPGPYAQNLHGFHQGLNEAGIAEGHNVTIEYRWAEDQYDQLPAFAGDLVRRQVTVIFANGPAALLAKAATTTIPIVFATAVDPVEVGLVSSLNQPGANLTGVTTLNVELAAKQLQLLHQLVPTATIIAALLNPTGPGAQNQARELPTAARALGLQFNLLHASTDHDLDTAFARFRQLQADALMIGQDAFLSSRSPQLAALALRHAVPAMHPLREFASAGGLMSYGGSFQDAYRLAGDYTGRILKGEKPSDLPVQQVTKLELVINLKTAKALGVSIPPTLLARADELIE